MAQFQYRLATLLRLRERARDERRRQLAEALAAEAALSAQRTELDQRSRELAEHVRQTAGRGNVDVDRIVQAQRYDAILKAERQVLDKQQAMLQTELERRRHAMVAATMEVRVLEKLRDRQRGHFEEEEQRKETKRLDEIAAWPHATCRFK
ncbi:MAG: flagellar export protein FliJ [Pirellulales bacterium]